MNRQIRYASRLQSPRNPINPAIETGGGHILSDGIGFNTHARKAAVEDARQKMQIKYNKEAKEAAERKKQKEQKKREAWLARQEALVRPGHVLGSARIAEQNLIRDYVEHQDEDERQQDMNKTKQSWMHQEYNDLVRQGIEREREAPQLQRRNQIRDGVKLSGQEAIVRLGGDSGYGGSAALGSSSGQVETVHPDHREQMLAARRRLQEKYDAQIQQAAEGKEQGISQVAE